MNFVKIKNSDFNLDDAFKSFDTLLGDWTGLAKKGSFSPRADITEDKDNFYINLEMPGVKKEDVKIYTENNVLYIKGEKKNSFNKEEKNLVVNERYYGSFNRSFNLTKDIKVDGIDAEFKDGILAITLPKAEEAKPAVREISVK